MRTLAGQEELDAVYRLLATAFGRDRSDYDAERYRLVFEPMRTHVVEHSGEIVGSAGVFTRELTNPGATVAAAHVTFVGVAPTHRRPGLLTRLMTHQLRAIRDQGEPVAALWASEGASTSGSGTAWGAFATR